MTEILDSIFLFLMFIIYIPVAIMSLLFAVAIIGEWRKKE